MPPQILNDRGNGPPVHDGTRSRAANENVGLRSLRINFDRYRAPQAINIHDIVQTIGVHKDGFSGRFA
jgi:hypothetical protein